MHKATKRAQAFADSYGLRLPVLMAPMAGACPPELAAAVADAGGMGACGALLFDADAIANWVRNMRQSSNGAFMLNTWVPDPEPARDTTHENHLREWLNQWGPEVPEPNLNGPAFEAQCNAMID